MNVERVELGQAWPFSQIDAHPAPKTTHLRPGINVRKKFDKLRKSVDICQPQQN